MLQAVLWSQYVTQLCGAGPSVEPVHDTAVWCRPWCVVHDTAVWWQLVQALM